MMPRLVSTPGEQTWERPRRPDSESPLRWPWIVFWFVIVSLVAGGWFAFAPEGNERGAGSGTSASASDPAGTQPIEGTEDGFALLHASWGAVDGTAPPAPPDPRNPTEWQQREQAFHEMGREHWKGTEIFVQRETR